MWDAVELSRRPGRRQPCGTVEGRKMAAKWGWESRYVRTAAPLRGSPDGGGAAMLGGQAEQSRRFAFEESPDITGKGGR